MYQIAFYESESLKHCILSKPALKNDQNQNNLGGHVKFPEYNETILKNGICAIKCNQVK